MHLHRVVKSGLVVKAARIQKTCSVVRFATKIEPLRLCGVFGESVTAGKRCRLTKISSPKSLWINNINNVVCGFSLCEPVFNARTPHDGIDMEYDGVYELFITMRYTRHAFTQNSLELTGGCDPLLALLIRRLNPHLLVQTNNCDELREVFPIDDDSDSDTIMHESEFQDDDGCVYRVTSMKKKPNTCQCKVLLSKT